MAGRGETSEIINFIGNSIDSEMSGNMIDVCPVGALTSKPFRYSARTWELKRSLTHSFHDSWGSEMVFNIRMTRFIELFQKMTIMLLKIGLRIVIDLLTLVTTVKTE